MSGPLSGIRVLDCTIALAGPFCSMILADLGADVIKIESSEPRQDFGMGAYKGESGHFLVVNRNKRGLAVNLKDPKGLELFYDLVRNSDVVVQNFRPGVMRRLSCDWETLREINPRLIYCSISGFGEGSPYADLAGLDLIAQGLSGLMSVTGEADGKTPVKAGTPICDVGAGMYGVIGIVSALYHRESSGVGQHIEATLLDTPLSWLTWRAAEYWETGEVPEPQGSGKAAYRAFRCADGRWVNLGPSHRLWPAACRTLGLPELIDDPRFDTPTARTQNHAELEELYQEAFLNRTSEEWIGLFQEVGIPVGPIKTVPEALDDPHATAREMVVEVDHPEIGLMKTLGLAVKLSETPGKVSRAAPLHGQDTEQLIMELGYTMDDIERWIDEGVVGSTPRTGRVPETEPM